MHRIMLLMAVLTPTTAQRHQLGVITIIQNDPSATALSLLPNGLRNQMTPDPKFQKKKVKSSSILKYIFDSADVKHVHDRYSEPRFIDDPSENTVYEAETGATVAFDCRISSLRDKTVVWLRLSDKKSFELLTMNARRHTADTRFKVDLSEENWQLELTNVRANDSGTYCCHISTYPPMKRNITLTVHPPEITMTKEAFLETSETLSLRCMVLHLESLNITPELRWYRGYSNISLDELRTGVLIDTDTLNISTHLQVTNVRMDDAGNYTCILNTPLKMSASAIVHVLRGSSLGELQSGGKTTSSYSGLLLTSVIVVCGRYETIR